ncbi:MAG: DNA polymerase III subunit gamma/tau [Desulfobulbaceae bacterium]|uniref:DNA polymerase III subunit gamma/tau n=1 Tax=Candidatus Desulfatifera sulfidica TaxID=2841691 RepID=A0A8J6N6W4_9BACT|nr:DNA polymerase III subunit gamma/tau [Candidatus Desulfatifera sulfidica]
MSYLVLARKARPQTFDEVVGQRAIVKTLQNSLRRNRVAHAILFSGVRGVGKTTLARIMAKALTCTQGPADNPCNECESCRAITNGSALDLTEIDGASNRGIQEIRELKEKIRFLPVSGTFRIIIIDEVHMLTTEAFNALLKTLEEPPEHVYFMFATTELHKIPITILSRCQRYELKRIPAPELRDHFQRLAGSEGVELAPAALDLIVREAEGSVRDGLSLLDQVFSYGEQSISVEEVVDVLGLVNHEIITRLARSLLNRDAAEALKTLDETYSFGMDLKRFTSELLDCFRSLILCNIKGCTPLLDLPDGELATLQALAAEHSLPTLHQKLNLLMQGIENIRYSSQPRLTLETTFLKTIEADNVVPVTELLGQMDKILTGASGSPLPPATPDSTRKKKDKPATQPPESKKQTPSTAPVHQEKQGGTQSCPRHQELTASPVSETTTSQPPSLREPPPIKPYRERPSKDHSRHGQESYDQPIPETLPPQPSHSHKRNVRRDWSLFIDYVRDRSMWMAQDLQRVDSIKEVDHELRLHYSDPNNCALLRTKENIKLITEFTLDFFQKELTIRFILPQQDQDSEQDDSDSPKKQRQQLSSDPLVQMTTEIFNGQVGDIRVGPRFR